MERATVAEPDVLFAVAIHLIGKGIIPYQFSIARGSGIDATSVTERLQKIYGEMSPSFVSSGPDIIAFSGTEWWQVECKGTGTGTTNTLRNNFDRALASVVSYYEDAYPGSINAFKSTTPVLALALPDTDAYMRESKRRLRPPLRKRLNLRLLIYRTEIGAIVEIGPTVENTAWPI